MDFKEEFRNSERRSDIVTLIEAIGVATAMTLISTLYTTAYLIGEPGTPGTPDIAWADENGDGIIDDAISNDMRKRYPMIEDAITRELFKREP